MKVNFQSQMAMLLCSPSLVSMYLVAFLPIPVASCERPSPYCIQPLLQPATLSIPGTLSMKTDPTYGNPELLQGINPTDAKAWSRLIIRKTAVAFFSKQRCGYDEATTDTKERNKSFEENLSDFAKSDQILVGDFETKLDSLLKQR